MDPDPIARLLATPPDLPVRHHLAELVGAVRERESPCSRHRPAQARRRWSRRSRGRAAWWAGRRDAAAAHRRASRRAPPGPAARGTGRPDRRVHGARESRSGPETRIEVVTTGVLLRRLQRDPELAGVSVVVLDEVHERHLDADLTLALLVDVRPRCAPTSRSSRCPRPSRPSARPSSSGTARRPGRGRRRQPLPRPGGVDTGTRPEARRARRDPAFLDHVAATTRRALAEQAGDVLVFVRAPVR
ncbi:hypothetical protein NKG05_28545 [Oerskovia sp. M15]